MIANKAAFVYHLTRSRKQTERLTKEEHIVTPQAVRVFVSAKATVVAETRIGD